MSVSIYDSLQALAVPVAVVGGLVAIFKTLYEMRESRVQRGRELRWKQVEAAKKLIDQMLADKLVLHSMLMLDWDSKQFEIRPGALEALTTKQVLHALRTDDLRFSEAEAYVRDCFDQLFFHLSTFQHYIQQELVRFADCSFPIDYYVRQMAQDRQVFVQYANTFGFPLAVAFLRSFPEWNHANDGSPRPS